MDDDDKPDDANVLRLVPKPKVTVDQGAHGKVVQAELGSRIGQVLGKPLRSYVVIAIDEGGEIQAFWNATQHSLELIGTIEAVKTVLLNGLSITDRK